MAGHAPAASNLQASQHPEVYTIYGSNIHTHVRNAVTLVWDSLRLAPIIRVLRKFGPRYRIIINAGRTRMN